MPTSYEKVKAWRALNPERVAAQAVRRREKHRPKLIAATKQWKLDNPDRNREYDKLAKREYRKTPEYRSAQRKRQLRFKAKVDAENIRIAGRPKPDHCELCALPSKVVFDHCHANGHFRGWICDRCNRTLGQVKDSIPLLCEMISYLERNKGA